VVLATVLGSGMAMLDMTAVNVALPTIGHQLSASLSGLQWIVSGYSLALAGLILLGGSLGDRLGRRRVFVTGVIWFALASALCGLAPVVGVLIAARVLQGIGGALLVPGSLAIIQASFAPHDRPRAIGLWSGLAGLAAARAAARRVARRDHGWRWVFLINLPVAPRWSPCRCKLPSRGTAGDAPIPTCSARLPGCAGTFALIARPPGTAPA
jgi:MFS family permease